MLKLNNRGAISITYLILIMTVAFIIMGFSSITIKTMSINEIQGILDEAGVMALRYAVDETMWRLEELVIDESLARNKAVEIVKNNISYGGNKTLKSFELERPVIYPPNHPNLRKLGIPSGERDQYYIVLVGRAKYGTYAVIDRLLSETVRFYNFFTGRRDAVMSSGAEGDGRGEVVVRSVSRLTLR